MSQLDEIIQQIIDEACPLDNIKDKILGIEINDLNIEKIQRIENLIELHEETSRSLKQLLRLKTSKYYRKKMINSPQINAIRQRD